jgi:hypothetical protein
MDRKQKIKVLKLIAAGELMPEDIGGGKVSVFWEVAGSDPVEYRTNRGEPISKEEMDLIRSKSSESNARREAAGLDTDKIIIVQRVSVKEIESLIERLP